MLLIIILQKRNIRMKVFKSDGLTGKVYPLQMASGDYYYSIKLNQHNYEQEQNLYIKTLEKIRNKTDLEIQQITEELKRLKQEIEQLKEIISGLNIFKYAAFGRSEQDMDEFFKKINDLDKRVAIIEERTKKLDEIPTKSEVENILLKKLEEIPSKSEIENIIIKRSEVFPSRVEMENMVLKAKNSQLKWTIGAIGTAAGIIIGVIKIFLDKI